MQKDSVAGTLIVAFSLCVLCSVLVSTAAVSLKDRQDANKVLDVKKNLLLASGLIESSASKEEIESAYEQIQAEVIDLETGKVVEGMDPVSFNQRTARKDPKTNTSIPSAKDLAGIKTRSKYSTVYKVVKEGRLDMVIFPVNGKGLWSTLYGFLAMSADLSEVRGIGFYEHAETPGLGGEVDNPNWKAQWVGKKIFDEKGTPVLRLVKGSVAPSDPEGKYKVDGLSGATITSNGVTGMVQYWLGEHGFGSYIENNFKNLSSKVDHEQNQKSSI